MTERPYREVPLSSTDLELDKTLAGWVLTAWPPTIAPAVLRLRIPEYLNSADPFPVVYEMRSPGATEFRPVAATQIWPVELFTMNGHAAAWSAVPESARAAFLTMFRTLGALLALMELGGTPAERYPGEPLTSRDYFCFGAADDRPRE